MNNRFVNTKRPLKMIKNAFYFTLKAFSQDKSRSQDI